MSDIFAFDEPATQPLMEAAQANSVDSLEQLTARPWQGFGLGVGNGFMRGGTRAGQAVGMAGGALALAIERSAGVEPGTITDPYFRGVDEFVNNAVDYWTPRPEEVGKAGQIIGGLGEIVLPLAAGGGSPIPLIASQELGRATDLVRAGVDSKTAVEAGVVSGAAAAAGLKIPILGSTLTSRLASGAAGNVAFGAGAREAENLILHDHADQQSPVFDLASLSTDALTGLLFGGLHHSLAPRVDPKLSPSQVDAVLTARNARSFQSETAPGAPDDVTASVGHQEALSAALEQVSRGQPVDVAEAVTDHPASFTPNGHVQESIGLADEVAQQQPKDVPYEREPDQVIEQRFREQLNADPEGALARYAKLEGSHEGRVLNTDLARELSPDYRADRTRSAAVHEPASDLVKQMYAKKLAEAPSAGQEPLVVFSAGGTGAGKSVGLEALQRVDPEVQYAQIVYDTNLNNLASSTKKIDQALQAGKKVHVVYTWRHPVAALTEGALPRAMRMGRTVPLSEHAKTHVGASKVIKQLQERYRSNPDVSISAIDNSRGPGEQQVMRVADVPELDYNQTHEELRQALEQQHEAGAISEAVYRGTADTPSEGRAVGAESGNGPSGHEVSGLSLDEALKAQSEPVSDIPEVASLQRLADQHPDLSIYTGLDADGSPVRTSLADVGAQIQREYEQDLKYARAYEVAVQCFLGHGA